MKTGIRILGFIPLALLWACETGTAPGVVKKPPPISQVNTGHNLATQTMGCWLGSIWSDAEGYLPPQRRQITEAHCKEVLRLGFSGDASRMKALRGLEPVMVEEVARKGGAEMGGEAAPAMEMLLKAVADAKREMRAARRAGTAAKRDLNDPKEVDALSEEERAALAPLGERAALTRLLNLQAGPLAGEAHALALLVVMERMELARALPKHLRIFALEVPGSVVFGISPPSLPKDPATPLSPGQWVNYQEELAKAAGHPVPDRVTGVAERQALSWNGIVKGLADRLREDEKRLSASSVPALRKVVAGAIKEADDDYEMALKMTQRPQSPTEQKSPAN